MVKNEKNIQKVSGGKNKPDAVGAFIREVNEDIYEQSLLSFWRTYRLFIYAGLALIIVGTASYEISGYFKNKRIEREALRFEKIIDDLSSGRETDAVNGMKHLADRGHYGYKDMAFVNLYSYHLSKKQIDEAVKVLDSMQKNAYSKNYRHYAVMQYAYLKADEMKADELHKLLKQVINKDYGFKYDALYMLAVKYIDENNLKEADKIIKSIAGKESEIPTYFRGGFGKVKNYLDVNYNEKK